MKAKNIDKKQKTKYPEIETTSNKKRFFLLLFLNFLS